jgi:type IV pilus assembly protein PilB
MAAVDIAQKDAASIALPGLGRALISAGKLTQKAAEDIARKAQASRNSFIAEVTGAGAVSASDLAHTVSSVFGAPLLDLNAIDPLRLPRDLLDAKICQTYRVVVLSKRNNRLIVATADPTDQEAAEKIKFTTQLGVDWVIAEYDKLVHLIDANTKSTSEAMDSYAGAGDFEFEDASVETEAEASDAATDVEDAPIVKFLHKMLLDAFNMRASDLHFEPYEHHYRVRFRVDGELREIASPPIAIKDKLAHQGHFPPGYFGKARPAGWADEAQSRAGPRDRFSGQHASDTIRRENRDPYSGSEQRQNGDRGAGLRTGRKGTFTQSH